MIESTVQQEPVQFNTPEPYKQSKDSIQAGQEPKEPIKSTLWQTLNDRTTSKKPSKTTTISPKMHLATDRMDTNMDYMDQNSVNFYIQQNGQVFRPNLVPSVPDPNIFSPQLTPHLDNHIKQVNPPSNPTKNGDKLMSPFLEPPGHRAQPPQPRIPSVQWADPNGFLPSQLHKSDLNVMVTPMSQKPNNIPLTIRPFVRPLTTSTSKTTTLRSKYQMPDEKFTAQQIIRQQMLNRRVQNQLNAQDDMTAQSSDQFW